MNNSLKIIFCIEISNHQSSYGITQNSNYQYQEEQNELK